MSKFNTGYSSSWLIKKKGQILFFYMIYVFMFLNSFINEVVLKNYISSEIFFYFRIVGLVLLLIKFFFFDSISIVEVPLYLLVGLIIVLSAYKSKNYLLIDLFITMLSARGVNNKRIVKISFIILTVSLSCVIILSLLNVIPNLIYTRVDSIGNEIVRNSFGTTYPTIMGSFIFFWSLQLLYIKRNINYIDIVIFISLAIITIKYTDNRLVFVLMLIVSLYSLLFKITKFDFTKLGLKVELLWGFLIIISVFGFVIISKQYEKKIVFIQFLDQLLSGRVKLSWQGLTQYPVSLFGNNVQFNGWGNGTQLPYGVTYFYLDVLPINLLVGSGVVIFIIYILYNISFIKKCFLYRENHLLIILTLIIIYDLVDNKSIRIAFNPFILIYFNTMFSSISFEKNKEFFNETN